MPPGGEIGSKSHVLNDHTYCCQLGGDPAPCATGEPNPDLASECLAWHEKRIGTRSKDAERLGIPYHVTEFGACLTEGPCTQEITQVCDVADEHLVGWAYWQFKYYEDLTTSAGTGSEGFYNQDGSLQGWKVKALSRSYLMYTQGVLTSQKFNTETAGLEASFTYDAQIAKPTVIYQNNEYWCGEAGCGCTISQNGQELPSTSYTTKIDEDLFTSFLITDTAYDGLTVDISCAKNDSVQVL